VIGLTVKKLAPSEYHPYYAPYIHMLGDMTLAACFKEGVDNMTNLIDTTTQQKINYSYGDGKWTLGEVLMHIIDAERIFQYRALRFARGDKTPLASFDQDTYVLASKGNQKNKDLMLKDFLAVRQATISLFESFDLEELSRVGIASDAKMSVRALGFLICGHQKHHLQILRERYL